ncbi:MAG: hypothetical protein ACI9UD_002794, partial [Glaciecola sp.]
TPTPTPEATSSGGALHLWLLIGLIGVAIVRRSRFVVVNKLGKLIK